MTPPKACKAEGLAAFSALAAGAGFGLSFGGVWFPGLFSLMRTGAGCPQEQLLDKCMEMARTIAENSPTAVRAAKGVINKSMGMELHQRYGLEVLPFSSCFLTNGRQMAMSAFVEKRQREPLTGA